LDVLPNVRECIVEGTVLRDYGFKRCLQIFDRFTGACSKSSESAALFLFSFFLFLLLPPYICRKLEHRRRYKFMPSFLS
jgi:hypothetical protein